MTTGDNTATVVTGDPMISFADNVITINVAETLLDGKSYFVRATTNGGVTASKELFI